MTEQQKMSEQQQQISREEMINIVAATLQEKHGFATKTMLDNAVQEIVDKTAKREARPEKFSISTMIRGLRAIKNEAINPATAEEDVKYVKALTTGSTPGSYLVPTIQANDFISMLATGSVARQAGARIWDMPGIQNLTIPTALTSISWVRTGQNSQQTPTDPNFGQLSFTLKEARALTAIPNRLLATSVPAFETILTEMIGQSAGEHEDSEFFSTTTVSGAGASLYATATSNDILVGGAASGGNLAYSDILATMAASAAAKAKPPFVWITGVRTFYQRILGLIDTQSRPLVMPGSNGMTGGITYMLMGWPIYVTPYIAEDITNVSGTNQSWLVFTNPRYLHIAQDGNFEIAMSTEHFFASNQTAIRVVRQNDFGYAPEPGIIVLKGIN